MTFLGLFLAALMGLALGLLGGGGSILAVPIFVYALGFGAKEAIASSLAVVGATSLFAATGHWREGQVRFRVALIFGVFAAAGAYLGARFLAGYLSDTAQLVLFAAVMMVAAFFMFRDQKSGDVGEDAVSSGSAKRMVLGLAVPGVGVGLLTGLVGVGGGFLIVPALVLIGKVSMEAAVGTSLLIITMNSFAGFVGYLGTVEIQWGTMAVFTALAIVGGFAGTYLVRFLPQESMKKSFAVFLIAMALFILYENRGAFF